MSERARLLALTEATTYLLLMLAVIVKYGVDRPLGVEIMGPIHGVLVLVYAVVLWQARDGLGWDQQKLDTAIVLGAVPLGGYWVERNWLRPGRPSGGSAGLA